MTAAELPWVVETRLAPGERRRRSPLLGILALVAALCSLGLAIFGFVMLQAISSAYTTGYSPLPGIDRPDSAYFMALPFWGILTLLALGLSIAAFVKRGVPNIVMGIIAVLVVLVSNPVLSIIMGLMMGVL